MLIVAKMPTPLTETILGRDSKTSLSALKHLQNLKYKCFEQLPSVLRSRGSDSRLLSRIRLHTLLPE